MADRISHREEGETERKGYAEQADANMREACRNNGAAAATKSQPKSANRFSRELPQVHFQAPLIELAIRETRVRMPRTAGASCQRVQTAMLL